MAYALESEISHRLETGNPKSESSTCLLDYELLKVYIELCSKHISYKNGTPI